MPLNREKLVAVPILTEQLRVLLVIQGKSAWPKALSPAAVQESIRDETSHSSSSGGPNYLSAVGGSAVFLSGQSSVAEVTCLSGQFMRSSIVIGPFQSQGGGLIDMLL